MCDFILNKEFILLLFLIGILNKENPQIWEHNTKFLIYNSCGYLILARLVRIITAEYPNSFIQRRKRQ